ncbi:hypothetical protein SDC9_160851 [bioreactor metagenome]|uniref:Uncharacterized protein n=1 Tax=bioreactor metagenome TaxID=1076179 RepID=A0A645FHU1_9ZZZZ
MYPDKGTVGLYISFDHGIAGNLTRFKFSKILEIFLQVIGMGYFGPWQGGQFLS